MIKSDKLFDQNMDIHDRSQNALDILMQASHSLSEFSLMEIANVYDFFIKNIDNAEISITIELGLNYACDMYSYLNQEEGLSHKQKDLVKSKIIELLNDFSKDNDIFFKGHVENGILSKTGGFGSVMALVDTNKSPAYKLLKRYSGFKRAGNTSIANLVSRNCFFELGESSSKGDELNPSQVRIYAVFLNKFCSELSTDVFDIDSSSYLLDAAKGIKELNQRSTELGIMKASLFKFSAGYFNQACALAPRFSHGVVDRFDKHLVDWIKGLVDKESHELDKGYQELLIYAARTAYGKGISSRLTSKSKSKRISMDYDI